MHQNYDGFKFSSEDSLEDYLTEGDQVVEKSSGALYTVQYVENDDSTGEAVHLVDDLGMEVYCVAHIFKISVNDGSVQILKKDGSSLEDCAKLVQSVAKEQKQELTEEEIEYYRKAENISCKPGELVIGLVEEGCLPEDEEEDMVVWGETATNVFEDWYNKCKEDV